MSPSRKRSTPPKPRTSRGATFATVCQLARAFPGVEEGLSWGTPGLKVKGRFMARLKEDGESLVIRIGFSERERLMRSAPAIFYLTDHYLNYPALLVRLPKISRTALAKVVEECWRTVAPETLVAAHDAGAPSPRRSARAARRPARTRG